MVKANSFLMCLLMILTIFNFRRFQEITDEMLCWNLFIVFKFCQKMDKYMKDLLYLESKSLETIKSTNGSAIGRNLQTIPNLPDIFP